MEKAFHIATQCNATQLAVPIRLEVGRCEGKEKTEMEGRQAGKRKEGGRPFQKPVLLLLLLLLLPSCPGMDRVSCSIPMVLKRLNEN